MKERTARMLTRCESNSGKNAQLTLLYEEARVKRKYDFNTGDFDTGEGGGEIFHSRISTSEKSSGIQRILPYHRGCLSSFDSRI